MKLGVWFCNSIGYVTWIKIAVFQFDVAFGILSSAARLMRDRQTGRMKGFGFVKYSSQAEAEKAVKAMDGRVCAFFSVHLFPLKTWLTDANKLWCLQIVSCSCLLVIYLTWYWRKFLTAYLSDVISFQLNHRKSSIRTLISQIFNVFVIRTSWMS